MDVFGTESLRERETPRGLPLSARRKIDSGSLPPKPPSWKQKLDNLESRLKKDDTSPNYASVTMASPESASIEAERYREICKNLITSKSPRFQASPKSKTTESPSLRRSGNASLRTSSGALNMISKSSATPGDDARRDRLTDEILEDFWAKTTLASAEKPQTMPYMTATGPSAQLLSQQYLPNVSDTTSTEGSSSKSSSVVREEQVRATNPIEMRDMKPIEIRHTNEGETFAERQERGSLGRFSQRDSLYDTNADAMYETASSRGMERERLIDSIANNRTSRISARLESSLDENTRLKHELAETKVDADLAIAEKERLKEKLEALESEFSEAKGSLELEKAYHNADLLCWQQDYQNDTENLHKDLGKTLQQNELLSAQLEHSQRQERILEELVNKSKEQLTIKAEEAKLYKTQADQVQIEHALYTDIKQQFEQVKKEKDTEIKTLRSYMTMQEKELSDTTKELDVVKSRCKLLEDENSLLANENQMLREEKEQESLQQLVDMMNFKKETKRLSSALETKGSEYAEKCANNEALLQKIIEMEENGKEEVNRLARQMAETLAAEKSREKILQQKGELQAVVDAKKNMEEMLLSELQSMATERNDAMQAREEAELKVQEWEIECKKRELEYKENEVEFKTETEKKVRREMSIFAEELRDQFDKDWSKEEKMLKARCEIELEKMETTVKEEKERTQAATQSMQQLSECVSNMESKLQSIQEARWEAETQQKKEQVEKENLNLKCLSYEREVAKLRSELQQALIKNEDDQVMFKSAEACLQEELVQLRKQILRFEIDMDKIGGA